MTTTALGGNRNAAMDSFRNDLAADHLRPLWDIMGTLAAKAPANGGQPVQWRWPELEAHIARAGELVTAEEAERRVLVLANPAFAGEGRATNSLYAGVQMILPGEVAPSHRHTASALRLILESAGAFTAVDGERVIMSPGDFIITPGGTFHDHGNHGDQPAIWLDGLDVFVVNLLNAPFGEAYPESSQPIVRPEGDSLARYGSGLVPHGFHRQADGSPMFWWPYSRTLPALQAMSRAGEPDRALGFRMNFIDPTTGSSPIKTMTAAMSLFPAGFGGEAYRSVSGSVVCMVEGTGRIRFADTTMALGPRDVCVIPSWAWHQIEADEKMILFGFSDEVLQRHLGFWREERRPSLEELTA